MNRSILPNRESAALGVRRRNRFCASARGGFSLIEVVVAMFILVLVAAPVVAAVLQSQRLAVSNLAQSYAEVTAQSIIEQLVAQPYTILTDGDAGSIAIKLPGLDSANRTTMDDFLIPWADNDTDFTDLGTPDPSQGILVDAAYIRESNTIRPERFMPMRVNLRREMAGAETEHRVIITLRYQWAVPDRRGPGGAPVFLSGAHRTVRSSATSF
jgi:prepilin-type N-terminal cleavage/methylation domain-containing protein